MVGKGIDPQQMRKLKRNSLMNRDCSALLLNESYSKDINSPKGRGAESGSGRLWGIIGVISYNESKPDHGTLSISTT